LQAAAARRPLLKAGAIDGLSIGFRTVKGRIDPKTRVRSLVAMDVWEIPIVTFPAACGGARARGEAGVLPT
jgi:HK97 family phage prohead protease